MALILTHHSDAPLPFTPHSVRFPGKASSLLMSPLGLFTLEIGSALLEGGHASAQPLEEPHQAHERKRAILSPLL